MLRKVFHGIEKAFSSKNVTFLQKGKNFLMLLYFLSKIIFHLKQAAEASDMEQQVFSLLREGSF